MTRRVCYLIPGNQHSQHLKKYKKKRKEKEKKVGNKAKGRILKQVKRQINQVDK